jgi:hypothetical protein
MRPAFESASSVTFPVPSVKTHLPVESNVSASMEELREELAEVKAFRKSLPGLLTSESSSEEAKNVSGGRKKRG